MKVWCGALLALLFVTPASAQGVPRIKARIVSLEGQVLTVTSGAAGQTMTVGLTAATRIERQENRALTDIKPGDYVGATIVASRDGLKHAQEVHVFSEDLRGTGEGLFALQADHSMIDGTVRQAGAGTLSLDFRGADGADGPACTGRAPKTGGCHGSADILVAPGVPVTALVPGDKSLLVPDAIIALSVMAGPDGRPVTPGLIVQAQTPVPIAPPPVARAPAGKVPGR